MKRVSRMGILTALMLTMLTACGNAAESTQTRNIQDETMDETTDEENLYTLDTAIEDVINDAVFGDYGRLIFPVDDWYYSGNTLGELQLTYYSNIDADETVAIANCMKEHAAAGDTIFYDIYTEEAKT